MAEVKNWNLLLLKAIGQSNFSVEEVAYLCETTEAELYDIIRGYEPAGEVTRAKLAAITGKNESELFQGAA